MSQRRKTAEGSSEEVMFPDLERAAGSPSAIQLMTGRRCWPCSCFCSSMMWFHVTGQDLPPVLCGGSAST